LKSGTVVATVPVVKMIYRQIIRSVRRIIPTHREARRKILSIASVMSLSIAFWATPQLFAADPLIVTLTAGTTAAGIQKALDSLPASGGEVVLPEGKIEISQPIALKRDFQTLRGAGAKTVLFLSDNANCPVIIMGEPVNRPKPISHLQVSDLFIDGNLAHQQREIWKTKGEGSEIRNNGIIVQNVSDSVIEHVTTARCRSGGLVTTLGTRELTVRNLNSFDNEFDGFACYLTEHCFFTNLYLHDNPGAGLSLDGNFNHNVIDGAVLTANDLGIFMRWSRDNQFRNISIRNSHNYGVFMAQNFEVAVTLATECVNNSFTNFVANECGSAAFRINDVTCSNNVLAAAQFTGSHGKFSLVRPDLLMVK
jgi:hypothetical protein